MFDLNRLLNVQSSRRHRRFPAPCSSWKLLRGSHEFPGPGRRHLHQRSGDRRRRLSVSLGAVGRRLSVVVLASDVAVRACASTTRSTTNCGRKLLLPFVTRLAGSADSPRSKWSVRSMLMTRIVTDILAPALAQAGLNRAGRPLPLDHARRRSWLRSRTCHPQRSAAQQRRAPAADRRLRPRRRCRPSNGCSARADRQSCSAHRTSSARLRPRCPTTSRRAIATARPPTSTGRRPSILEAALEDRKSGRHDRRRNGDAPAGRRQAGGGKPRAGGRS